MSNDCIICKLDTINSIAILEEIIERRKEKKLSLVKYRKINTKNKNSIIIYPKFNKDWKLIDFVINNYPYKWKEFFEKNLEELNNISNFISKDEFYPNLIDVFNCFKLCSPKSIKVVIIGQDPYPKFGNYGPQAMGLSFSVRKGESIPKSLKNIFIELERSIDYFKIPDHGDLTSWAKQGVFLLNKSLTVIKGDFSRNNTKRNHRHVWDKFIKNTLLELHKINDKIIYVFWGKESLKLRNYVRGKYIIEGCHPAERRNNFIGCNHFVEINKILIDNNIKPINWKL